MINFPKIKFSNYFILSFIICFISFFIYQITYLNYKGYYILPSYYLISQIILETNFLFIIVSLYIHFYQPEKNKYFFIFIIFPFIYILLFLTSLYLFNNNNNQIENLFIAGTLQLILSYFIIKKYRVNLYNKKIINIILPVIFIMIFSSAKCYINIVNLNNYCINETNKHKILSCIEDLDYKQISFYKRSLNGSNIVKIFNHNSVFKKEAENFIHANAKIKDNYIQWEID